MKKIAALILVLSLIIPGCLKQEPLDSEDMISAQKSSTKAIVKSGSDEFIVYARFGVDKGIFISDAKGESVSIIYEGIYDKAGGTQNNIVSYIKNDNEEGISLIKANDKSQIMLLKDYMLESRPSLNQNETFATFLASKLQESKAEAYYVNLLNNQVNKLEMDGEIKDISFLDNENLIYSKKVKFGEEHIFQIFKYNIKTNLESRIITSEYNDINPVISADGKKVAFLSDRNNKYNLYILNKSNNLIESIDMKDAIVGGTVNWSKDGKYIACVTLNGGSRDQIKLADVKNKTVENIDKGYITAFSKNSKYLIYAAYEPDQDVKKQVLLKRKIGDEKSEKIMDFPEEGRYSKSINMLFTLDF
jgi:Tol biopolymer transport system component